MISEGVTAAVAATLAAGLAAVALHETAETVRAFAPNSKRKVKRDKSYDSLIWG